jgi:hypothetical protein
VVISRCRFGNHEYFIALAAFKGMMVFLKVLRVEIVSGTAFFTKNDHFIVFSRAGHPAKIPVETIFSTSTGQ